jgi:hypothetical protein
VAKPSSTPTNNLVLEPVGIFSLLPPSQNIQFNWIKLEEPRTSSLSWPLGDARYPDRR